MKLHKQRLAVTAVLKAFVYLVFIGKQDMNMFTVLAILCLSAPITAFKISLTSANESEYGKAYPGFTVFEKDGQYARFIGKLCSFLCKNFTSPCKVFFTGFGST